MLACLLAGFFVLGVVGLGGGVVGGRARVYVLQVVGVKIGGKLEVRLLGSGQGEGRWLWAAVLYRRRRRWWYVSRVRFGRCNNH